MIAFNLYSKIPFGKIHDHHPEIAHLAKLLKRPPASLSMKMCNLATLDPQHIGRIKGLRNPSKMERVVWKDFCDNPGRFMLETEKLMFELLDKQADDLRLEPEIAELPKGETRRRLVNARLNQSLFRKIVLSAYNNKCCMTGIAVPELLNASHIIPWSENPEARINPHNGLCLNVLHDRAFDRGLISVSPDDLAVHVSQQLREEMKQPEKLQFLLASDKKSIEQPTRFSPDREFLDHHYRNIFQK